MGRIAQIVARQIYDSLGQPAIEVDLFTERGAHGRASVASNLRPNKNSATSLIDNDKGRFFGRGVIKSIDAVNKILNEELRGLFVAEQNIIDAALIELDGTPNKSNLGANTMLAVSLASARAAASNSGQSLFRYLGGVNGNTIPIPYIDLMSRVENFKSKFELDSIQLVPNGASNFSEAYRMAYEVTGNLRKLSEKRTSYIDSRWIFNHKSVNSAIEFVLKSIEKSGFKIGEQVSLAIDVKASRIYDKESKSYYISSKKKLFSSEEYYQYFSEILNRFPIISVTDLFDDDDHEFWIKFYQEFGERIQIVGDDLYAGNLNRLQKGLELALTNAIVINTKQIGTLTEIINLIQFAQNNGMNCLPSAQIAETDDLSIVDIAVALNCGQIKLEKLNYLGNSLFYNELIRVEEGLGAAARFWGVGNS